jgi:hypothetical protein
MAALMQCQYNPEDLRLDSKVLNGSRTTPWSRVTIESDRSVISAFLSSAELFLHLSQLLHGSEAIKEVEIINLSSGTEILAVSIDNMSVYYRALLDAECFDQYGRVLAISSGRFSSKGVLRRLVKERSTPNYDPRSGYPTGHVSQITKGFNVVPTYAKGPVSPSMHITAAEEEFWAETCVFHCDTVLITAVELTRSIHELLCSIVGHACTHDAQRPYMVKSSEVRIHQDHKGPIYLATFLGKANSSFEHEIVMYALKDCLIEQLLQIGISESTGRFQGEMCIECLVNSIGISSSFSYPRELVIMN